MRVSMIVAAAAAVLLGAQGAAAQDRSANPNYGSAQLSAGFSPDPYRVSVTAGGTIDASRLGSPCRGRISNAPDFRVNYQPGSLPLLFRTTGDADTTLIVNAPDGRWYCDDDSFAQGDAEVRFNNPRAGNYEVWVGTYAGGTAAATLFITELESGNYGAVSSGVADPSRTATYGEIFLRSGFTPDPHVVNLTAGGSVEATTVSSECRGRIASAPDYQITYTAGSLPLVIRTQSSADTTLVVNGPAGEYYCDDDTAGNLNAQVRLNKPASGVYDIWVGTFGDTMQSATLLITELP